MATDPLIPVRCWTCTHVIEPKIRRIRDMQGNIDLDVSSEMGEIWKSEGKDVYDSDAEDEDTGMNMWDMRTQEVTSQMYDKVGLKRACCRRICVSCCATQPAFGAEKGDYASRSNMYRKPPTRQVKRVYKVSEC